MKKIIRECHPAIYCQIFERKTTQLNSSCLSYLCIPGCCRKVSREISSVHAGYPNIQSDKEH